MYIFILIYTTTFFYSIEKYKANFFLYFLALIFLFVASSIQYDVGTDYFSYKIIYETGFNLDNFANRGEIIFPYIIYLLRSEGFGYQSLFVVVSLLNTIMLTLTLVKFRSYQYRTWLLFFIFFCVTGLFHNQMNGLRQYMAIYSFPLILFFLCERKVVKVILFSCYALFSHISSVFIFPFIFLSIIPFVRRYKIKLFFISALFYGILIPKIIHVIIPYVYVGYESYLLNSEGGMTLIPILTRLYYLPLILYFIYLIYNRRIYICNTISDVFITIFMLTYWIFLSAISIDILGRVAQLTMFFYVFPVYFVFDYFIKNKMNKMSILLFSYIVAPYFMKVTIFANNEYIYNWIL